MTSTRNPTLLMQAAEQRAGDEKSCASGALAQREAERAAKASVESKVIDLTLDDMNDYTYSDSDQDITTDDVEGARRRGGDSSREMSDGWSCTACTFINLLSASHCDMCVSARPKIKSKVVLPSRNSNPTSAKSRPASVSTHPDWSCSKCTLDNPYESWSCGACRTIKA